MSNNVLVTGGGGQVAQALVETESRLTYIARSHLELDITDPTLIVNSLDQVDPKIVVNTAAYTAVDKAECEVSAASRVNILGPKLLSSACGERGIPLIHLSTDYVFNEISDLPLTEKICPTPVGVYGLTKFEGEQAVRANLSEHIILRLSGIFSIHGDCFPAAILKSGLKLPKLRVVDDQITGPTSARSIAYLLNEIIPKLIERRLPWGTYHFSQQPFLSWFEFAQIIVAKARQLDARFEKVSVRPVSTAEFGSRAPRPKNSRLDSRRITAACGLDPEVFCRDQDLDDVIHAILHDL